MYVYYWFAYYIVCMHLYIVIHSFIVQACAGTSLSEMQLLFVFPDFRRATLYQKCLIFHETEVISLLQLPGWCDPSRKWERVSERGRSCSPIAKEGETSPLEKRLQSEMEARGMQTAKFARVQADYYTLDLDKRRSILGAPSIYHL